MKILNSEQKTFVRIIIGSAETGDKGIKAPMKTLSIEDTSVGEMYEEILDLIQDKRGKRN